MGLSVLKDIDCNVNFGRIVKRLKLDNKNSQYVERLEQLFNKALEIARPKCAYKKVDTEVKDNQTIVIGDVKLNSKILSVYLGGIEYIFPFVATCGKEVSDWAEQRPSILDRFWLDHILDEILNSLVEHHEEHLKVEYGLSRTGSITPGSIDDWPINQQKPLFDILGDVESAIGVHLLETGVMDPCKSLSGIVFYTKTHFSTCMFCPREDCPKRRAKYNKELADRILQSD